MPALEYLLYALSRKGHGSGHRRRMESLGTALRQEECRAVLAESAPQPESGSKTSNNGTGFGDTLVVADMRTVSSADLAGFAALGTPLLVDDAGPVRNRAPYLVDIIPGPRDSEANLVRPGFMDLPARRREPDASGDILVSFGGEDAAGLTSAVLPVLEGLGDSFGFPGTISCTLPSGRTAPSGVSVLTAPGGLRDHLGDFGLVICSYGLTAWEALAAGCSVLTVDPSPYHAMLSMNAGLAGIGYLRPRRGRMPENAVRELSAVLADPREIDRRSRQASAILRTGGDKPVRGGSRGFAEYLSSMEAPLPRCAACGASLPEVIRRFPVRSYYRCTDCGMIGLYRFRLKDDEYGPAYFQNEYEAQYGRSYLEDFEAIRDMGRQRLDIIDRKAVPGGALLDIGCAFGPFMAAAAEAGYRPYGSDVSEEGTRYIRDTLGFPALAGRFPGDDPAAAHDREDFDVVSLWYVIEHFPDLESVLEKLSRLVTPGGVLALSTPNGAGISSRVSLDTFLEKSPVDHYTIWTPSAARRLLRRYGFHVYRIRITGHHPERFPWNPETGSTIFRFTGWISRLFGLGDTFEVYAVKEKRRGRQQ